MNKPKFTYSIDSIRLFYEAIGQKGESTYKEQATWMMLLRSWITEILIFDPVSGKALPQNLVHFMNNVAQRNRNWEDFFENKKEDRKKDRIYHIVSYTQKALSAIAAATSSWVDKGLQPVRKTSAPPFCRTRPRLAVFASR